jgi:hypothetical protein
MELPAPTHVAGSMTPSTEPYFPYPSDPTRRLGFIIGDLISAAVIVLILSAVLKF